MDEELTLLWGDIETGGLNGKLENGELGMHYYPIFEIAIIVTDLELETIGEPLRLVIHQSEEMISRSYEWAIETHTKSGLLKEVRESGITLQQAESLILEYLNDLGIKKYDRKKRTGAIFAGNSISFDRSFIMCQMPTLSDYMHYRQFDVSAVNLAFRFWNPELAGSIVKEYSHEALADIKESIQEAKVYKDYITL